MLRWKRSLWRSATPSKSTTAHTCVMLMTWLTQGLRLARVRQLTGRSKAVNNVGNNAAITTDTLNDHYAAISDDASYSAPCIKSTVNTCSAENHISEWWIFKMLNTLKPNCNGNAQYLGLVSALRCFVLHCRACRPDELTPCASAVEVSHNHAHP